MHFQVSFDGNRRMWYIIKKEMPDSRGHLHYLGYKAVLASKTYGRLYFLTLSTFKVRESRYNGCYYSSNARY